MSYNTVGTFDSEWERTASDRAQEQAVSNSSPSGRAESQATVMRYA